MSQFVLAFSIVWSLAAVMLVLRQVLSGIRDLRTGVTEPDRANLSGLRGSFDRKLQPREYKLVVGGKFLAVPMGAFVLWFASDIFWS